MPILCQKKKQFKEYLKSVMKEIYGCLMKLFPRSLGASREQLFKKGSLKKDGGKQNQQKQKLGLDLNEK